MRQVRDALRDNLIDTALRDIDRAWRNLANDAATVAPIYGRLLCVQQYYPDAALRLLQRATEAPDPDIAALTARALLQLQRSGDGRRQLESALAEYCLVPGGLLSEVVREALQHSDVAAPGWIGLGPTLEFSGELTAGEPSDSLQFRVDGGARFTPAIKTTIRDGRLAFAVEPPPLLGDARLQVSSRGVPLLGSGLRVPSDFSLDGRAEAAGGTITGWARIGWLPAHPVRLRIEDESGRHFEVRTGNVAGQGKRWPFRVDVRARNIRGSRISIAAQLPDGRWQPLPDSPLLLEPAVRLGKARPTRLTGWNAAASRTRRRRALIPNQRLTDVIIPVYRGHKESLACIATALATLDRTAQIVVVDDATDDTELASALDALATDARITLLRNETNQGFVVSVQRAMSLNPTHDVVLLNSDTLVFDDWLQRMRAAAYSDATVGTVTPLSNSGSIASYPRTQGAALEPEDGAAMHALAAATHSGRRIEIPVGVGFCLYIRRDCLEDIGSFDAGVFGKGYGEETDFCLRARQRGWSHQLAADVFVYHAGGMSFAGRRAALLERSQRLINLRHPGYDSFIASFLARDPLQRLRRGLDERRLSSFDGQFVLMVTLALSGGVDRFVAERCRAIREQGLFPLVLRAAEAGNAKRCELWTDAIDAPNLQYDIPADLAALTVLLGGIDLNAVEIQHFLHLDARVIDAVRALDVPHDIYIHDYAWICPRVTLIDGSGRYCGEPPVSVCQSCIRRNGSNLGEAISVPALRTRSATWLRHARRVIAPSADTAARLQRHFPDLPVEVRPHTPAIEPAPREPRSSEAKVLRVALIGAIGQHKGYQILLDCARDARARMLPLEFVLIGYSQNDAPLLKTGKVYITGRYSEAEATHLLAREQPDIAFMPSVWPETWCYTLDYAIGAGLPVVAFDLGAMAERLRAAGLGILLPLDLNARHINDRLLQLAAQRLSGLAAAAEDRPPLRPTRPTLYAQTPVSRQRNDANMRQAAEMSMIKNSSGEASEEALSASVQILPLPAGLYLFSVKEATPVSTNHTALLSLPAVHVGLGPGVRSDQVEFIAGPPTHGAWLFSQGDLLVAKVNGSGATLILSSVRAPGGETLSIKVERLDTRAEVAPAAHPKSPAIAARESAAESSQAKRKSEGTFGDLPLPLQIGTHIRSRGDMSFQDVPWAGRVAPGLWMESFSIRPLERFGPQDIEYKGLTGSGFETPWLSDDKMCGTKGMAVPLVGFAVRLKPSARAANFDCEYSGYFQSGLTAGPLRNGAPCRSTVANDPLEGIQVRIVKRTLAAIPLGAARPAGTKAKSDSRPIAGNGPSFGRYRDGNGAAGQPVSESSRHPAPVRRPTHRAKSVKDGNGTRKPVSASKRSKTRNGPAVGAGRARHAAGSVKVRAAVRKLLKPAKRRAPARRAPGRSSSSSRRLATRRL